MNLNLKNIGQFIYTCRKDLGMTQAELAERLGVTPHGPVIIGLN